MSARQTKKENAAGRQKFAAPLRCFKTERARVEGGIIPPSLSCLGVGLWYDFHPTPDAPTLIRHWLSFSNYGIYEGLPLIRHLIATFKNFFNYFLIYDYFSHIYMI